MIPARPSVIPSAARNLPLRKAQGGQGDAPRHPNAPHVIPAQAGIQRGGAVGHPPLTSLRSFAPPCAGTKGAQPPI